MTTRNASKSAAIPWLVLGLCLSGAASSAPTGPATQEQSKQVDVPVPVRGKKLVLKDGTAHTVRSWERQGERVRFYSVERSMWEEIPAELVDFEATKKAEEDAAHSVERATERMRQEAAIREAEDIDVDSSIKVGPNSFLPEGEGMFAVDCPPVPMPSGATPAEGAASSAPTATKCKVLPMVTLGANVKTDKKRALTQVLAATVGIPVVGGKQRVTVPGKQAVLRLSTGQPEFYIRMEDNHEPEMELIVAKVKGDKREIDVLTTNMVGEKNSQRNVVSVERWPVARRVYRLTMSQSLPPGEYVLAEIVPAPEGQEMNLLVWDFGIDAPGSRGLGTAPPPKKK